MRMRGQLMTEATAGLRKGRRLLSTCNNSSSHGNSDQNCGNSPSESMGSVPSTLLGTDTCFLEFSQQPCELSIPYFLPIGSLRSERQCDLSKVTQHGWRNSDLAKPEPFP